MAADVRSDAELMQAFQRGDADAFTVLYQRHLKGLVNFFWRLSWDRSLAEDLAHDTVLRLFRSTHEWEDRAKFTTYLYRIARNLWIDHTRLASTRKRAGSLDAQAYPGLGTFAEMVAGSEPDPGEMAASGDVVREIMAAVARLPEEQRLVFVLAHVQEMRYQDVADVLEVPVGTVKSRMHAAVAKLQAMLGHLVEPAEAPSDNGRERN